MIDDNTWILRYVKLAYFENTTCVKVIFHSRISPDLYFIVFRPRLCRTRLSRKLCFVEVIFIPVQMFSVKVLPPLVSKSKCVFRKLSLKRRAIFGRHFTAYMAFSHFCNLVRTCGAIWYEHRTNTCIIRNYNVYFSIK